MSSLNLLYGGEPRKGGNGERFNYSIHGKGISAAGLICHSNNVQLKRENASIILLLECPGPKLQRKTCTFPVKGESPPGVK